MEWQGPGLVLQNNGGSDLAIDTDRSFTFPLSLSSGTAYQVTVKANPAGRTCTVTDGSGTIGSANVANITVTCTAASNGGGDGGASTFSVGGTITGLAGSGLVLRNGAEDLAIPANSTSFEFSNTFSAGADFNVVIAQQPANPAQVCAVTGGSGTVTNSAITTVSVVCTNVVVQDGLIIGKTSLALLQRKVRTLFDRQGRCVFDVQHAARGFSA